MVILPVCNLSFCLWQPKFLNLAFGAALAVFLTLEIIRVSILLNLFTIVFLNSSLCPSIETSCLHGICSFNILSIHSKKCSLKLQWYGVTWLSNTYTQHEHVQLYIRNKSQHPVNFTTAFYTGKQNVAKTIMPLTNLGLDFFTSARAGPEIMDTPSESKLCSTIIQNQIQTIYYFGKTIPFSSFASKIVFHNFIFVSLNAYIFFVPIFF